MRTLSYIIHAELKIDLMLRKICPSGSPLDWDGQWEILLLAIEAFGSRCHDLSANTVHLLQLWAGTGFPLFWRSPRFRIALSDGCGLLEEQSCFPGDRSKQARSPADGAGNAGLDSGTCQAEGAWVLSVWAKLILGISDWVQRRECWWDFSGSGYRAFPVQFWYPGLLMNSGLPDQSCGYNGHIHHFSHMPLGELCLQGLSKYTPQSESPEPQQPQDLHFCQVQLRVNVCSFSSVFIQCVPPWCKGISPVLGIPNTRCWALPLDLQIYFPVNIYCHMASSVVPRICSVEILHKAICCQVQMHWLQ